jgi:CMP-2-keto-3-deoxyoctulosonic acid synthetase
LKVRFGGILGKPKIQHVWENAKRDRSLDEVVVACDDDWIKRAVRCLAARSS